MSPMFPGRLFCLAGCLIFLAGCGDKKEAESHGQVPEVRRSEAGWKSSARLGYEIVGVFPHDTRAFTQGLILSGGEWWESTGGYGTSVVRRVEKASGRILAERKLSREFFGEGLAEWEGKLFQLTWKNGKGFVYDKDTLSPIGEFSYQGEGWGLTTDGTHLILSDGTDRLRFLDPESFEVEREIAVRYQGQPLVRLNELEYVEGEIFANVWHSEYLVRIDPESGMVRGTIDLSGIGAGENRQDPEHVLNGIAYDDQRKELFVTGKCWSRIYQIRLVPRR